MPVSSSILLNWFIFFQSLDNEHSIEAESHERKVVQKIFPGECSW